MRAMPIDATMTSSLPMSTQVLDVTETLDQLNSRYADALLPLAVLMGIFCVVGIFGNVLVIVIFSFSQEYRKTNFRVFVVSLGIIDLLSCISLMPAEILKTKHYFLFSDPIQCKAKCFFNVFAMNAAAYVLFVICIDRYRKVCQPLKKQIWPGLAFKISLTMIILSVFLSVPAAVMCGIQTENVTNIVNTTTIVQVCSAEEEFQDSILRYVYKFTLTGLLLIIAFAYVVMYILIVRVIIKHKQTRSQGDCIRFDTSSRPRRHSTEGITNKICVDVQLVVYPNRCLSHEQLIKIKSIENFKLKFTAGDFKAKRSNSSLNSSTSLNKSNYFIGQQTGNNNIYGSRSARMPTSPTWKFPYKTLIWLTLTLIFLVTFIIHAGLSFLTLKEHLFTPSKLFWYQIFFRLYFVNNIINPLVYGLLDRRFKASCKRHFVNIKKNMFKCY